MSNEQPRLIDANKITADCDLVKAITGLLKKCQLEHKEGCLAGSCEECISRLFSPHYNHILPVHNGEGKWEISITEFCNDDGEMVIFAQAQCSCCKTPYHRGQTILSSNSDFYRTRAESETISEEYKNMFRKSFADRLLKIEISAKYCEHCGAKLERKVIL